MDAKFLPGRHTIQKYASEQSVLDLWDLKYELLQTRLIMTL